MDQPRPMIGLLVAGCTLVGVIVGFSMGLVARTSCHHHVERAPTAVFAEAPAQAAGFLGVEIHRDSEWLEAKRGDGGVFVSGARVARVLPRTPAEATGFQAGDLIVRVEGETVTNEKEVSAAIRSHRPGSVVRVGFFRDGEYRSKRARLVPLSRHQR